MQFWHHFNSVKTLVVLQVCMRNHISVCFGPPYN